MKLVLLRNDDVGEYHPNLKHLLELFKKHNIPSSHAVIPADLQQDTLDLLQQYDHLSFLQHGWSHKDYGGKSEFPESRSTELQHKDLYAGLDMMTKSFPGWTPTFCPPFHGYSDVLMNEIDNGPWKLFSGARGMPPFQNTLDLPCSFMMEDWQTHEVKSFKEILKELNRAHEDVLVIVCHHDMFDDEAFQTMDRLIDLLKKQDNKFINTDILLRAKRLK